MQENKLKSYIGFAIKSNKIIWGFDNILLKNKDGLIIVSSTINEKNHNKIQNFALNHKIQIIMVENLEKIVDRNCKVLQITDKSLINGILNINNILI